MPAKSEWSDFLVEVARLLRGEPNEQLSTRNELRFGGRGSLAVDIPRGTWYDHEAGAGGGALQLIQYLGASEEPMEWVREHGLQDLLPEKRTRGGRPPGAARSQGGNPRPEERTAASGQSSSPQDPPGGTAEVRDAAEAAQGQAEQLAADVAREAPQEGAPGTAGAQARGERLGRITATYDYCDEAGQLLFQCVRYEPKTFRQRRPIGNGRWAWNLDGVRMVPYHLSKVAEARTIFIAEGEKDVAALEGIGVAATCNPMGAGKWPKMAADLNPCFRGKKVHIIPDCDIPGRRHARQVAQALHGTAELVKIVELPGLADKEDASDWIGRGGTREQLLVLAHGTAPFQPDLIVDAKDHLARARMFMEHSRPHLARWRGEFFDWTDTSYYKPIGEEDTERELWLWLEGCFTESRRGRERLLPSPKIVSDTVKALRATAGVGDALDEPAWRDGRASDPKRVIVFPNGYVDTDTMEFFPPTDALFATSACRFEYDPEAPLPEEFLMFLDEILDGNEKMEQIRLLQEIMGYVLSMDTSLQKMFLIKGPPRSGKGTIVRILEELLSPTAVINFNPVSLDAQFGTQDLVGRRLIVMNDLRLGPRHNLERLTQELLNWSADDAVNIMRKNIGSWRGKLGAKVMIVSNEVPQLKDPTGTIATRFLGIETRRSFSGRENIHLFDRKLVPELPGILLWALGGLRRLRDQGKFTATHTSELLQKDLRHGTSVIQAFIDDECVRGPEYRIDKYVLYRWYTRWCERKGVARVLSEMQFSRQFADTTGLGRDDRRRPKAGEVSNQAIFIGVQVVGSESVDPLI